MTAGATEELLAFISNLRGKAAGSIGGAEVTVASCFEAGRDGFWLHRLLTARGVINHVVEPTKYPVREDFKRKVRSSMRQLQNNPAKIRAFYQKPSLQYAA